MVVRGHTWELPWELHAARRLRLIRHRSALRRALGPYPAEVRQEALVGVQMHVLDETAGEQGVACHPLRWGNAHGLAAQQLGQRAPVDWVDREVRLRLAAAEPESY